MEKFVDIKYGFKNIKNSFCQNVQDRVGRSIDNEQLTPYEQTLHLMEGIEEQVEIKMMNIDRLLEEARAILPKV